MATNNKKPGLFDHGLIEKNVTDDGPDPAHRLHRRPGRDHSPVHHRVDDREGRGVRPYSPLEQFGRNIYVREGCYNCHSQQIRPFRDEAERYGHYSLAAESMYDHPFQWSSKRTGPDLARVGGKYSDDGRWPT